MPNQLADDCAVKNVSGLPDELSPHSKRVRSTFGDYGT